MLDLGRCDGVGLFQPLELDPTWGRIWFVEHFHPLSADVGLHMPGVPLQPVGQAGLPSLCSLCLLPPWVLSEAQGAHASCPKVSSEGRTGPQAAASSSIAACLAPHWSWLSQVPANGPQHQQVTVAESGRRLNWGMGIHHRAAAKWGPLLSCSTPLFLWGPA